MNKSIAELKQELEQLNIMISLDCYTQKEIRRVKVLERIIKQYRGK